MMGYLSIGIAFGLMLEAAGYNFIWAAFMSLAIYAGSGQYLGVELLKEGASIAQVAFLTFMINFRHLVYGLSMLEKFRDMGKRKFYMIFSLTDETYALLSSGQIPPGVDAKNYYFFIALLDQCYWVAGSVIGSIAGALLRFNTTGVDFAMTALFIVLAIDQWRTYPKHAPAIIGAACTLLFLLLVGPKSFLLPSLGAIVVLLMAFRNKFDDNFEEVAK